MSSEWIERTLDDLILKRNQGVNTTTEKVEYAEKGIIVIRANNIGQAGIDFSNVAYVDETTFKRIKSPCKPKTGDILYTNIGSQLGNAVKVDVDFEFTIAWNVLRIQPSKDIDADFLVYLLNNPKQKQYIKSLNSSSTMPFVSGKELGNVSFLVPSKNIQIKISRVLRSLDNKIHLNQQINQTLEQMAQAIFKSWFVDFEPVKAKIAALEAGGSEDDALLAAMQAIAGSALFATDAADADAPTQLARLQTEHPEQYATLRATAELFPAAMQDSELGEIPEGWSVNKIEDLIQRISVGKRYSQKTVFESGSIPVLDQGKSGIIGYHNDEPGLKASEDDPVIVFANHTCYMRLVMHDFSAIQNVLPFKGKELNIHWIYLATLGKQKFTEYKGHWPDFVIKDVVTPNNIIASNFGSIVKNLFITQFHNEQQSASLSNIRDTLLPKLLSGELSVSAAADQITQAEEAVNVQS